MLPSANISTAAIAMRLGELVNNGLTRPKRTASSQTPRKISIEMLPSSQFSLRCQKELAARQHLDAAEQPVLVALPKGLAPCRPRGRARAVRRWRAGIHLSGRRDHAGLRAFLLNEAPEVLLQFDETRLVLHFERACWRQIDRD